MLCARRTRWMVAPALVLLVSWPALGQVVPGTGTVVQGFGDDFEDPEWAYVYNGKKSSNEDDGRIRYPLGYSQNRRWTESTKRGHPDYIARVDTPPGGLPGSKGALRIQTRDSGIPGRPAHKMMQDDLLCENHMIDAYRNPNYVVRVYVPPFDQWENRSGSSFGFRLGCRATTSSLNKARKRGIIELLLPDFADEAYWPGMFIQFNSSHDGSKKRDSAVILCRGGRSGREFQGPAITPGWWTLGLSVSPDGAIHYYASPGVDRLTPNDRIGSSFPYQLECDRVTTMFFNVCSGDNTRDWSTSWIIDDPTCYTFEGAVPYAGYGAGAYPSTTTQQPQPMPTQQARSRGFLGGLFR